MTSNENEQLLKSGKDKWLKLMRAMGGVGVSEKEVMKIVTVLAVIYHIGAAGYVIGNVIFNCLITCLLLK